MTGNYHIYNGKLIQAEELPAMEWVNRSFLYGDGLFETIRGYAASPLQFDKHWQRLQQGIKVLQLTSPDNFKELLVLATIEKLLSKLRLYKGSRVRISVYRSSGGFYSPTDNKLCWLIQATATNEERYTLNAKGLLVDIYDGIHKPINLLSNIKTSNALLYVLAGEWRRQQKIDEALILNQYGRLVESVSSNVFLVQDKTIITPPLTEGCIMGVMRQLILKLSERAGFRNIEKGLTEGNLIEADEVFITNTITGIQWIGAYKDRRFFNFVSRKMIEQVNEQLFIGK